MRQRRADPHKVADAAAVGAAAATAESLPTATLRQRNNGRWRGTIRKFLHRLGLLVLSANRFPELLPMYTDRSWGIDTDTHLIPPDVNDSDLNVFADDD